MKTRTQTTDKQLALHNLQELRQRLNVAPTPQDQSGATTKEASESESGLMSGTGFMTA